MYTTLPLPHVQFAKGEIILQPSQSLTGMKTSAEESQEKEAPREATNMRAGACV
jgi:hypothetical protein